MFLFSTIDVFNITLLIFRFVHVLRSLDMNIPSIKMFETGIHSLAIHPSETSLMIAAGDRRGNISET
jgi:hypothetical protein